MIELYEPYLYSWKRLVAKEREIERERHNLAYSGRSFKRNEEKTSIYKPDTTAILKYVYSFKTVYIIDI
jgi:hypothetical protein